MKFIKLVEVFEQLEKISSGNKLREILSTLFKKCDKKSIDKVAYFTLGKISSNYADVNIGMADKLVIKAVAIASRQKEEVVKSHFKKMGDIGKTAQDFIKTKKSTLTVDKVFAQLHKMASSSGKRSQKIKLELLANLLKRSIAEEAKYITRIILGTLRLGVGDMTILDSLAITFTGKKENKKTIEYAYNLCPDIGAIAKIIANKGINGIKKIDITFGMPIQMMLAQRVDSIQTIREKMKDELVAEEKYDGERVQAHISGEKIILFSRRLENITHQFPDIIMALTRSIKNKCIIEGEIVPVDKKGNLLPFQTLMQRRRKYEVEEYIKKVPVMLYLFDILLLKKESLIKKDYPERRRALESSVKENEVVQLAKQARCRDIDCVEEFFNKSLERGCEGIVAKSCASGSVYQAGTRGWRWIKWKREYSKELADTFDLVVIGAFRGKGRRSGTYGALLCATYNDTKDVFETLCKLGSGFTDPQLKELPHKLKKYFSPKKPKNVLVKNNIEPDVWLEPNIVLEVLGAEITRSPLHTCSEQYEKGLALRFPRFLRYRPDKKAQQATTSREVQELARA